MKEHSEPSKEESKRLPRPIEELWIEEYYGMNPGQVNERMVINTDYGDIVNLLTMFKEKFIREAFNAGYSEGYEDAHHHVQPKPDFETWQAVTDFKQYYNYLQHERK